MLVAAAHFFQPNSLVTGTFRIEARRRLQPARDYWCRSWRRPPHGLWSLSHSYSRSCPLFGVTKVPGYYALLVATITADMADQWVVNLASMTSSESPPASRLEVSEESAEAPAAAPTDAEAVNNCKT